MKNRIAILMACFYLLTFSAFAQENYPKEIGAGVGSVLGAGSTGFLYRKHTEKSSFRLRLNPNLSFNTAFTEPQTGLGGGAFIFLGKQKNVDLGKKFQLYYGADFLLEAQNRIDRDRDLTASSPTFTQETIRTTQNTRLSLGALALGGISWKFHDRLALSLETHYGLVLSQDLNSRKNRVIETDSQNNATLISETDALNERFSAGLRWFSPALFLTYFFGK